VVTTINAWNRIAISLGAFPGHVGQDYSRRGESSHGSSGDASGVIA
jgi:hypothetical protein